MPRISAAFYAFGVLCLVIGMLWGMHMAKTDDFTLATAHAHLNLLGGVLMAIFGTFYALTRESYSPGLAWANFVVSVLGVIVLLPSLVVLLSTHGEAEYEMPTDIGSGLVFLGLLIFGVSALRELFRRRA